MKKATWARNKRRRFLVLLLGLSSCGSGRALHTEALEDAAPFDTQTVSVADAVVRTETPSLDLGGAERDAALQDAALPTVTDSGSDAAATESGVADTARVEFTDSGSKEDTTEAGAGVSPGSFTALPSMNTPRSHHSVTVLSDGRVLFVGGVYGVFSVAKNRVEPVRTGDAEIYDPATETFTPTGSLPAPRLDHTATLLPDGKVLIAGGTDFIVPSTSAELYDPTTGAFQPTGALLTARIGHTATLLDNGKVLIAGGDTATCELYDPTTGSFAVTGSMTSARRGHTTTLLGNGKVLIVGGAADSLGTSLDTAELYDPVTGTFSEAGHLTVGRDGHSATRLEDGRVLIAGGEEYDATTFEHTYFASAEVYDPATGAFTPTGSMSTRRIEHTATLLANGKVLFVGGWHLDDTANSIDGATTAELYDPATGSFTGTGTPVTLRSGHRAVLLASGEVLLVGESGVEIYDPRTGTFHSRTLAREDQTATLLASGKVLFSAAAPSSLGSPPTGNAVLYDPVARLFTSTGEMVRSRLCHTATLLPNNQVLFAGGRSAAGDIDTVELYDQDTGAFSAMATMTPRCGHTATLLADGRIFIAGGIVGDTSTEVFDVATASFTTSGSMSSARKDHTATLLPNGKVLLVGGWGPTSATLASAELYDPATGALTNTGPLATGRIGHTATLLPDGRTLVVGGWSGALDVSGGGLYVGESVATAEVYDASTGSFSPAGALLTARLYHSATTLPDGEVLIVGGSSHHPPAASVWSLGPLASTELFDPATGSFSPGPSMAMPRVGPTATLLPDGEVLVVGGNAAGYHGFDTVAQVELYSR